MKFVPRREKIRKGFSSPDGIALLAKATKSAKESNYDYKMEDGPREPKRAPMNSVTISDKRKG
jgi:hypothetical protein